MKFGKGKVSYPRTIKGKVTDDTGEGLSGVNIAISGITTEVTTDLGGNYQISVSNEYTVLVFSAIGMSTQEVKIGSRSTIYLSMAVNPDDLREVVVGGVHYTKWYSPRGLWWRTRGFIARIF